MDVDNEALTKIEAYQKSSLEAQRKKIVSLDAAVDRYLKDISDLTAKANKFEKANIAYSERVNFANLEI